ncbi:zinc finger CCHC domain-containing protein 7-like isoform X1 [Patiria miniata]|uniref:Zinc finger CCHC domain-containing protein 7 n=1 Tax=Patiria miniata TaxID=46514 RepID=A0A914AET8_PATMI|nr:zinc finger CCHC domain-containing protein 7-like isoform X1 [Patiria miniata]XP_038061875.1 zinc finger CCHC domain-containing protein 7-like isoform X2 [Patiria miniata]XP_038061876.1 zinc finger CCHC domain-containing protein 7-like isoform X1 [Patiria miniata]
MDPFQRILTTDTGSEWDTLHESDNESERYSSGDEIGEIEEALLQRIHYAEDCGEDFDSAPTEGITDTFLHFRGDHVAQITVANLDIESERTNVNTEKKDVVNIPVKGESLTSVKVEKSWEPASDSPLTVSDDSTNVRESSKKQMATLKNESPIWNRHGSDSESESKYKAIKSRKTSSKKAGNNSNSVIDISSSSDGTKDWSGENEKMKNLVRSDVDIVSINCREGDSDVGSVSDSEIVFTDQISEKPEQSIPPMTKRQWRKSKEDPSIPAEASKKMKLKRTVAELRTILDEVKDSSSEDDLSDMMVIESHSEDEALDVNYDSTPAEGRGYNQDQSYERSRSRGRYYQEPENWPRYKCYSCLEFGHMTRDCPKPRQRKVVTCVLCGTQGHNDRQCPDALCFICSEPGHQARECPNKKLQYLTCHRCSMKGHTVQQCPDRWRQYHLTTEPGKIQFEESRKENQQLLAVNGKVFCYNCSKEGHFGHECWEEPMNRRAPLILPYVVRYDQIPRRFWKVQMDATEPPENARGFNDRGPDAGVDVIAPSMPPKKERKKTRMKRLRAEKLAAAVAVAAAAAAALNQDKETKEPSTSKKKGKKAKKRKLEQTESIAVDSNDHVDEQVIKKCRKKNKEELEADKKLRKELATVPRAERKRIIRKKHVKSKWEALKREEILTDYEETEEYVRKGGHILRKRNNSVREAIAIQLAQPRVETQTAPVGKKKKKKPKQSRSEKRAWKKYQQEQRLQQQQQQQVSFNFTFEQFPELERKFVTQNQDNQQQQFHQEVYFSSTPVVNQSKGGGAKKNRRKPTQKTKGGGPNVGHTNFQGYNPQLNIPTAPDQTSTKPMSKRQQKKREYYRRLELKWAQKQATRPSFKSERGFKVEPKY